MMIKEHAIGAKDGVQHLLHRGRLLVGQRLQAEVKARMVIQDRQRLHRAGHRLDGFIEIPLPKTIWRGWFNPLAQLAHGNPPGLDQANKALAEQHERPPIGPGGRRRSLRKWDSYEVP